MLLTITYIGENACDLGYLLHKNPARPQVFALGFGKAYVFYPKAEKNECTAALLLDVNPIDLARGKVGSGVGGLFDYINDRPYVASSFLVTALARVFGTAMSGNCKERPELATTPLHLKAHITNLPCRVEREKVLQIFEPLGYTVSYTESELDETFPQWGKSDYLDLTLEGTVRLSELLNHLYVLIPAFDRQKHYWMSDDEVEKLLKHGEGWLKTHPQLKWITRRYFYKRQSLANSALRQLLTEEEIRSATESTPENAEEAPPETEKEEDAAEENQTVKPTERRVPLNEQRLNAVVNAVLDSGAQSVADLGCGEGQLLARLLHEKSITKLLGMDVSTYALKRAADRLHLERMPESRKNKLTLFQGSLTYRDKRLEGYETVCLVEVIEHLDPDRLPALVRNLFEFTSPKTVIVTTPNVTYNKNYTAMPEGTLRHIDHRFEWTKEEFQAWAEKVCQGYHYTVTFTGIGQTDENGNTPTQMGVFCKCE